MSFNRCSGEGTADLAGKTGKAPMPAACPLGLHPKPQPLSVVRVLLANQCGSLHFVSQLRALFLSA